MKAGAIFPAIVVNDTYEIVDGNSRWMASQRNIWSSRLDVLEALLDAEDAASERRG